MMFMTFHDHSTIQSSAAPNFPRFPKAPGGGRPGEVFGPVGQRLVAVHRADAQGHPCGHGGHRQRGQRRAAGREDPGRGQSRTEKNVKNA